MRDPRPERKNLSTSLGVFGSSASVTFRSPRQLTLAVVAKTPTPGKIGCDRAARTYSETRLGCQMSSSSPKTTHVDEAVGAGEVDDEEGVLSESNADSGAAA
mmetsp:Transcript_62773/g.168706  ORF Transcript_62773/g.168706 Transcript_62773/m.168706 type:complete len:102 (+) Transcript_62773:849-1154(+)